MDYRKPAHKLRALGVSIVPLRTDGSKLASVKWEPYQHSLMSSEQIEYLFKNCGGIAAITGKVSRLYNLDFDLKYQYEGQDYWKAFLEKVPKDMRKRFLVNETRSGGRHIWLRTDFEDKSSHYTRRLLTVPEMMQEYTELKEKIDPEKFDPIKTSTHLLKNPYKTVIESRSRGSYAVLIHPEYTRIYGSKFNEFSIEEVEFLNSIAVSLDFGFIPIPVFKGDPANYNTVMDFNNNADPNEILMLLESTGMYSYVESTREGDILIKRVGAKSKFSGKIFGDTGVLHLHSKNAPLFDIGQSNSFSPFEVFKVCRNLTDEQAINELKNR